MKISVVILTKNEELNIVRCLRSLTSFDDVHVIDSGSTDDTEKLAIENGAIVHFRKFDTFSGQRNFAHDSCQLKYDWVLHIDADEVMTKELIAELEAIISIDHAFDCFEIPSKLMFLGTFLKYSSDFPVYQVRLLKAHMRFQEIGHGQKEIAEANKIGRIKSPYVHFNFSHGLSNWLIRHVDYAKKEALEIANRNSSERKSVFNNFRKFRFRPFLKSCFDKIPFVARPFIKFLYLYLFRRGFLDGKAGLIFCSLQFTYELMIAIFYHKMKTEKVLLDRKKVKK